MYRKLECFQLLLQSMFNNFLALFLDVFVPLLLSWCDDSLLERIQTAFLWVWVQCCSMLQEHYIHRGDKGGDGTKGAQIVHTQQMHFYSMAYWLWNRTVQLQLWCFPLPDTGMDLDLVSFTGPWNHKWCNAVWRHSCSSLQPCQSEFF